MLFCVEIGPVKDYDVWDAFVSRASGGLFFQTRWLALQEAEGWAPAHVTVSKDGNIVGVLPNFIRRTAWGGKECLSQPLGTGGPLLGRHPAEVFTAILDAVAALRPFRHRLRAQGGSPLGLCGILAERGYVPEVNDCMPALDLRQGADAALGRALPAFRRDMARAQRNDLRVCYDRASQGDLDGFHRIYSATMIRKGVRRVHSRAFFDQLAARLGDDAVLATAWSGDELVAARIHLIDRGAGVVRYFFGCQTETGRRLLAGAALHKADIEWSVGTGMAVYDMGSTRPDIRDDLFRTKIGWGAEPVWVPSWQKLTAPFRVAETVRSLARNRRSNKGRE